MDRKLSEEQNHLLMRLKRFMDLMHYMDRPTIAQHIKNIQDNHSPQSTDDNIVVWRLALKNAYEQLEPVQLGFNHAYARANELKSGHGPPDISQELEYALRQLHPYNADSSLDVPFQIPKYDMQELCTYTTSSIIKTLVLLLRTLAVKTWMQMKCFRLVTTFQNALLAESPMTPLMAFRTGMRIKDEEVVNGFGNYQYRLEGENVNKFLWAV